MPAGSRPSPTCTSRSRTCTPAGDVAVEEGTFTGTHQGTLHSPAGDIVALRRMLHLVARPGDVLGDPAVVSQLRALVAARPELTAVAAGPTREELAA